MTLRAAWSLPLLVTLACSGDSSTDTGNSSTTGDATTDSAGTDTTAATDGTTAGTTDGTTAGTDSATTGGADDGTWELRIDNYGIPASDTNYVCFEFTVSADQLTHITGFTPVIDNGAYVHHYVVAMLDAPTGNTGYNCYDLEGSLVWVWTPGVENYDFPAEAGLLVGDKGSDVTFRIQVHYDNPLNTGGQFDNSGLDVHYTKNLREHNAGSFVVADIDNIFIPAGDPASEHEAKCSSSLTTAILSGPIHVFGSSLHAHEIGDKLFGEHWSGGQLQQVFNSDDPYNFSQQNFKDMDFDIAPGDEVITRCIYDASGRTEDTVGGIATQDEMCWNTLTYYPRENVAFDFCGGG